MTYEELDLLAKKIGFTRTAKLDISTIKLKPEVRTMCEQNSCGMYDKCWSCPPGCGTLEDCKEKINKYTKGILVQTVAELEDKFDGEGMMAAAKKHSESVNRMQEELLKMYPDMLTLGAGACKLCEKCAYPDNPCRQPQRMHSSMEAYGMVVLEVCKSNGLEYYYGTDHIAYTGCFLYE